LSSGYTWPYNLSLEGTSIKLFRLSQSLEVVSITVIRAAHRFDDLALLCLDLSVFVFVVKTLNCHWLTTGHVTGNRNMLHRQCTHRPMRN